MAKPLFPQKVEVINSGLRCTRIKNDSALLVTGLGVIEVPLAWWLKHQKDASFYITVTHIEEVKRGQKSPA